MRRSGQSRGLSQERMALSDVLETITLWMLSTFDGKLTCPYAMEKMAVRLYEAGKLDEIVKIREDFDERMQLLHPKLALPSIRMLLLPIQELKNEGLLNHVLCGECEGFVFHQCKSCAFDAFLYLIVPVAHISSGWGFLTRLETQQYSRYI
uniref:AlNc14C116G6528 protein n=1 Tax=Albugo laibachii Nc14 TaxID=890382 RepID=F0W056_9STRA|nr:AlNc14C3G524 [Albugo laibachii Nc14]CCA21238.1 AlNc14C116G6528 [Albugo laibachii Nc14]|eukprot:CCA21238.1 AlNc14C116G6528 [Albugo laibachii Nc14]